MFDFILKYWVEFAFGLIVTGGTFFIRRYWNLSRAEHQRDQEKFYNQIKEEISKGSTQSAQGDEILQQEIDDLHDVMDSLRKGLLSIQRRTFFEQCRELLKEDHVITLDEYQEIDADHNAYNGLGGNHNGDHLFELVKKKAENTLTKE